MLQRACGRSVEVVPALGRGRSRRRWDVCAHTGAQQVVHEDAVGLAVTPELLCGTGAARAAGWGRSGRWI